MESMDTTQRRGADIGDVSDREEEEEPIEEEAEPREEAIKVRLLRSVLGTSTRPRMEVPMYEGNLNIEEMIDWISAMDKYFEYENVGEDKRV